jgi:ribonuclease J
LRACIHRGAKEIGGSCVELDYQGARLVIDCGEPITPLDEHHAADGQHPLPDLKSLTQPDQSLLGVLLSHGHRDHWGQLDRTRADLPIYMGEKTQAMQAVSARWAPKSKSDQGQQPNWTTRLGGYLEDRRTFSVGPFDVTPYLVCHSGFDAYAFLVEAGGKRLFYSGDFRGHGRKAALFEALVARPPKEIDALLMEGSSLSRLASPNHRFETEAQTEARLVEAARATQGLMIVAASAQNIDRVVSIYRAAKRTGRTLVVDLYAAQILETCQANSIPQSDWPNMALWIPASQRRTIKTNRWFESLRRHSRNRVYLDKAIRAAPEKYILLGRPFMLVELSRAEVLAGAKLVWSQWAGYLNAPHFAQDLPDKARAFGIDFDVIHTSGHADLADLQKFATALSPKQLVPIHTFEPARYSQLFGSVVQRSDGQWWEV